jgi:hypothetical protein
MLALGFQCAAGADAHALTAEDAGGFQQGFVEKGTDHGIEAAAGEVNRIGVLRILCTDLDAART